MKVLIAGDYCPCNRVAEAINKKDYESVFGEVRQHTSQVDYSIVNLECPVVTGRTKPIEKYGPHLYCTSLGIEALKYAGFDCVTLANNHFRDYGDQGVKETLSVLEKEELDYVGGGNNLQESSQVLYKDIRNERIAIINCCEHEFSIATDNHGGSNPLSSIQQYYVIKDAKKVVDYVLVIVHGGHEMWQFPSPRMVETYRFFIDAGADAVVNHHQHCFSGFELYKEKPIFYGLGNFCFDNSSHFNDIWNFGYILKLSLEKRVSYELQPYIQCSERPNVAMISNREKFDDELMKLNVIINSPKELAKVTEKYYKTEKRFIKMAFEPYSGRFLSKLYLMRILPSFLGKNRILHLQNLVECEAHRDILLQLLNQKFK